MGEFRRGDSRYGMFDQRGNMAQQNEAVLYGSYRGLQGGSFNNDDNNLHASNRNNNLTNENNNIGFRLSEIPEPATIVMLALASAGIIRRRQA